MSITETAPSPVQVSSEEESAKRRQILQGAMTVFLSKGFDAASMAEIARAAGVSKGTLYVYFEDKEALFDAIVHQACTLHAENVFELDPNDHNVETALQNFGATYITVMCQPDSISAIRTVVSIAARMPDLGKIFYKTGPKAGIDKIQAYLDAQVAAGILAIEDTEVAAAQFMDSVAATLFKPVLFNYDAPTPERVAYVVRIAVRMFLAAYKAR
jgi:AcrR family transcriptional regulator